MHSLTPFLQLSMLMAIMCMSSDVTQRPALARVRMTDLFADSSIVKMQNWQAISGGMQKVVGVPMLSSYPKEWMLKLCGGLLVEESCEMDQLPQHLRESAKGRWHLVIVDIIQPKQGKCFISFRREKETHWSPIFKSRDRPLGRGKQSTIPNC